MVALFTTLYAALGWVLLLWLRLVCAVPMRVWAWISARPVPHGRLKRIAVLFVPHAVAATLWAAWMAPTWYLTGYYQPARRALAATHVQRSDVPPLARSRRPSELPRKVGESEAPPLGWPGDALARLAAHLNLAEGRAKAHLWKAVDWLVWLPGHPGVVGPQAFATAVGALFAVPFLASLTFLGPVWVLVLWRLRRRAVIATVSGRPVTASRGWRSYPRWRSNATAAGAWFAGESTTTHKPLRIGTSERARHTWIVGGTGSGKTESVLLPMLRSDIEAGRPVFVIDGKAEDRTIATIWDFAAKAGRESHFRYFDLRKPKQSHSYSPLLIGDETAQCDRIMAALVWDNGYYRAQSERVLLDLLRALRATRLPYSLDDLYLALSSLAALRDLAGLVPQGERVELEAIAARWKDYQEETSGLQSQLRVLLRASFGELLTSARPSLDLVEAYRERQIVYFALPPLAYAEKAVAVAKLVIGDLSSLVAMIQAGQDDQGLPLAPQDAALLIDEFASFAMPSFADLLAKARSARMMISIAHQSMRGDFERAEPGFAQKIAANTNIKIVLHQEGEEAEYVAGLSGTYTTVARTEQTQDVLFWQERTGLGSVREVDAYQVHPNLIRNLPPGVAVVKMAHPSVLDLVSLDRIDTATAPRHVPPAIERIPAQGLDLRQRVRRAMEGALSPAGRPSAAGEAAKTAFEGA